MTPLILKLMNPLILLFTVIFGVALQTSLFASYPLLYLQPDIILLVTLWCALHRTFTEGGILTLLMGNIAEIHSASPQGLFLLTYMLVYLGVAALSKYVEIENLNSFVMTTLIASIFFKLTALGVLHLMGLGANQWRHTLVLLLPGAVMAGVTAVWIFRFLSWLDEVTFKSAALLEE